jgi:hypothetical protein
MSAGIFYVRGFSVGFCTVRGLHCPRQRERVKESNKASEKVFSTTTYVAMSADIKEPRLKGPIYQPTVVLEVISPRGVVFNTTRKGPDILIVPIVTVFVQIVTKYT